MSIIAKHPILFILVLLTSCTGYKNNAFKTTLTKKDTIFILFDKNKKMGKSKSFLYKDHNPKYYFILYNFTVYWKEILSEKKEDEKKYGKEYVKKHYVDYVFYDDDYDHIFWFGIYKKNTKYPEFDDSKIYGNSTIIKRHKSFLKTHKDKIIDYKWFKKHSPPKVWEIMRYYKDKANRPCLFLIDKTESTKDSLVLKNVIYNPQIVQ